VAFANRAKSLSMKSVSVEAAQDRRSATARADSDHHAS
jgi:hypothetical protein